MSTRREPQPQSVDDVRDWFEAVRESLNGYRAAILEAFHRGGVRSDSRFFGLSHDEIDDEFDSQRAELEALTVLSLMASGEAAIRADYLDRVENRRRDPLSKAYIALHRSLPRNVRPSLDDEILGAIKASFAVAPHLISRFRDALHLRHWIAHGRYWVLTLGGNSYSPDDIYRTIAGLIAALP